MYEVKDKVFLVTGGAIGIGALVVRMFLEEKAKHVAILDVDVTNGNTLEKELNAQYGASRVKFYKCDVSTNDHQDAFDDVLENQGYIDVVVNNAGIMNDSPGIFEKEIAINLTALVNSSLKAFKLMRKDYGGKGGTIINVASVIALIPGILLPVYGATKSAVMHFSYSLGNEIHYKRSGVRVLAMCYSSTDTSLFAKGKMESFDKETSEMLSAAEKEGLGVARKQRPEAAARATIVAFKNGESGSVWLSTHDREALDITDRVKKSFELLSVGCWD